MPNTKKCECVSREDVVKVILSGIQKAHEDYYRMSGGEWMWCGPEYWVTTYVAKELWELCGDGVVVAEKKLKRTAEKVPGQHSSRFDIALRSSQGGLRAVIEIKKQQQRLNLLGDVERVLAALSESGPRFGVVAYYYSAHRKKKNAKVAVEEYASKLSKGAKSRAGGYAYSSAPEPIVCGDARNAWLAGCILLERKQGNKLR